MHIVLFINKSSREYFVSILKLNSQGQRMLKLFNGSQCVSLTSVHWVRGRQPSSKNNFMNQTVALLRQVMDERLTQAGAKRSTKKGSVEFSLTWDNRQKGKQNDLDLWVTAPSGEKIGY